MFKNYKIYKEIKKYGQYKGKEAVKKKCPPQSWWLDLTKTLNQLS